MTRGILLIALGHSNYRHMAITLAASIKDQEPDLQICLATDDTEKTDINDRFFNKIIRIPKTHYSTGKAVEYIKAKLFMYDLSPYEETIFLDVDQIMIPGRKLAPVFHELQAVEFTLSNTGTAGQSVWVDLEEVRSQYGGQVFWNYHSEFVYFKKSDAVKKYFDQAKKVYKENKLKTAKKFGEGRMADELAFQIASLQLNFYPHKKDWTPNFWFNRHKDMYGKHPYQLTDFLTYSIGGNHLPAFIKVQYNILAKALFAKLKIRNPYQVTDKRTFLPERAKI